MESKSIKSSQNSLPRGQLILLSVATASIIGIYIFASRSLGNPGFPLDDSWIHQTYARNLAATGEWAFRPGVSSAGSTSPLWSTMLSIGYLLNVPAFIWTLFLGGLTLYALAIICERLVRKLVPAYRPEYPWVGIVILTEWHLVWAAMSGMETLLHGLALTLVLGLLMTGSKQYLMLGFLSGVSVWIRPDGLTLLAPILLSILLTAKNLRTGLLNVFHLLLGFGAVAGLYIFFNLTVGGTPFPNTFYAKQAEYQVWQSLPISSRIGQLILQLLAGTGLVLAPGWVVFLWRTITRRDWQNLPVILWCAGYMILYVTRLPVYQHARYIMPSMPVLFVFGLHSLVEITRRPMKTRLDWGLKAAWLAGVSAISLVFIFLGARAYGRDVALIEGEMVATAKWVARELPSESLIAAHDIGALGYYDDHELVDLAGLISPEVIPFIRDETQLRQYLYTQGVDYLVVFPEVYPTLTKDLKVVFFSGYEATNDMGRENMTVYLWNSP